MNGRHVADRSFFGACAEAGWQINAAHAGIESTRLTRDGRHAIDRGEAGRREADWREHFGGES